MKAGCKYNSSFFVRHWIATISLLLSGASLAFPMSGYPRSVIARPPTGGIVGRHLPCDNSLRAIHAARFQFLTRYEHIWAWQLSQRMCWCHASQAT